MIKSASKTMRIDLIPGIAPAPLENAPQQMRIPADERKEDRMEPAAGVLNADVRSFFQSVYDAGFITDGEGRVREINSRAANFFQYDLESFLKLNVMALISGADGDLLKTVRGNLESERFTLIQAYCIRRDKTSFPAEIVVSRIGHVPLMLCFFVRDITLRRRAEEMLRTEHEAIQNAAEGIAVTNTAGEFEYVNPAVARLWRYAQPQELVGKSFSLLCMDSSRGAEILRHVMETGSPWRGEMKALRSDQTLFVTGVSAVCNRDTDGDVVGTVLLLNDLTDRNMAEQARREADHQRVMLETIGSACHHLGQPATVLTSNLELLDMKLVNVDEDVRQTIRMSIDACSNLAQILDRLRDVHEYRPTPYFQDAQDDSDLDTRIIEI